MRIIYVLFLIVFAFGFGYLLSPAAIIKTTTPVAPPVVTLEPTWKQLKSLDDQIIGAADTMFVQNIELVRLATAPATLTKTNSVSLKEFEVTNTRTYMNDLMRQRLSILHQLGYK